MIFLGNTQKLGKIKKGVVNPKKNGLKHNKSEKSINPG
jgi:hypothetical protein